MGRDVGDGRGCMSLDQERMGEPALGTHVTDWVNLDSQFTVRRQG